MKLILFALFLFIPLAGCAASQQYSQCEIPVPKTVALMPFSSVDGRTTGLQAAHQVALELIEKGYVVIDSSFTTTTVSESKFYASGLNSEVRNALLAQKLTTLVFGSIDKFTCETKQTTSFYGSQGTANYCSVSLAVKMIDTSTGKLLWGLMLADSSAGKNLTAGELMRTMIAQANLAKILPVPAVETKAAEKLQDVPK